MSSTARHYYPDEPVCDYAPEYSAVAVDWMERITYLTHKESRSMPTLTPTPAGFANVRPSLSLVPLPPAGRPPATDAPRDSAIAFRACFGIQEAAETVPQLCSALLEHGSDAQQIERAADLRRIELAARRARLRLMWQAHQAPHMIETDGSLL